jgi:hypothetical protein
VANSRSKQQLEGMIHRLNHMRSTPTKATLATLRHLARMQDEADEREQRKHNGGDCNFLELEESGARPRFWEQIKNAQKSISVSQKLQSLRKARVKARVELDVQGRERVCRGWEVARFAACAVFLFHHVKRKNASAEIIKGILANLGEWSRVRNSIRKLSQNMHVLQRASRNFLSSKKQRCDFMCKEWQRIEDYHLRLHCTQLAAKMIGDIKQQEAIKSAKTHAPGYKRPDHAIQVDNEMHQLMQEHADWTICRIPADVRRSVIARFYLSQLRKSTKGRLNLLAAVSEVVKFHKDSSGFLKSFGADESHAADLKSMTRERHAAAELNHHEFWRLTEDTALDLIAWAAHSLRHKKPWQDHPAHFDRPGNSMYRPHLKLSDAVRDEGLGLLGGVKAKTFRGAAIRAISDKQSAKNDGASSDLDELWQRFSPRLKALAKEEGVRKPGSQMSSRSFAAAGLPTCEQDDAAWQL